MSCMVALTAVREWLQPRVDSCFGPLCSSARRAVRQFMADKPLLVEQIGLYTIVGMIMTAYDEVLDRLRSTLIAVVFLCVCLD